MVFPRPRFTVLTSDYRLIIHSFVQRETLFNVYTILLLVVAIQRMGSGHIIRGHGTTVEFHSGKIRTVIGRDDRVFTCAVSRCGREI